MAAALRGLSVRAGSPFVWLQAAVQYQQPQKKGPVRVSNTLQHAHSALDSFIFLFFAQKGEGFCHFITTLGHAVSFLPHCG